MLFSEGNKLNISIAIIITIITILVVFYIWVFLKDKKLLEEGICGGYDQMCPCAGNETMQGGRFDDNNLSKITSGF
jgi:hypothetical protein